MSRVSALFCATFLMFGAACTAKFPVAKIYCDTNTDCPSGSTCGGNHRCAEGVVDAATSNDGALADASMTDGPATVDMTTAEDGSTTTDAGVDGATDDATVIDSATADMTGMMDMTVPPIDGSVMDAVVDSDLGMPADASVHTDGTVGSDSGPTDSGVCTSTEPAAAIGMCTSELFYDDFEGETEGAPASNFVPTVCSTGAGMNATATVHAECATRDVAIDMTSIVSGMLSVPLTLPTSGKATLYLDMQPLNGDKDVSLQIVNRQFEYFTVTVFGAHGHLPDRTSYRPGTWYHIALTMDFDTQNYVLAINGVIQQQSMWTPAAAPGCVSPSRGGLLNFPGGSRVMVDGSWLSSAYQARVDNLVFMPEVKLPQSTAVCSPSVYDCIASCAGVRSCTSSCAVTPACASCQGGAFVNCTNALGCQSKWDAFNCCVGARYGETPDPSSLASYAGMCGVEYAAELACASGTPMCADSAASCYQTSCNIQTTGTTFLSNGMTTLFSPPGFQDVTAELWTKINFSSIGMDAALLAIGSRANNKLVITADSAGFVDCTLAGSMGTTFAGASSIRAKSSMQLMDATWHHIACQVTSIGSTVNVSLLIDGFRSGFMSSSVSATPYAFAVSGDSIDVSVGELPGPTWLPSLPNGPVTANFDEVRLSSTGVYADGTIFVPSPRLATTGNTIALWHFDECMGTQATAASQPGATTILGYLTALVPPMWIASSSLFVQ